MRGNLYCCGMCMAAAVATALIVTAGHGTPGVMG